MSDAIAHVPDAITALAGDPGAWIKSDWVGGGGEVYFIPACDAWLKTATPGLGNYAAVLRFLAGKVNVPRLLDYAADDTQEYLLMSHIAGESLIAPARLADPLRLVRTLARAMRELHALDISACGLHGPFEALMADSAPTEREWLLANRPPVDAVFTHGDACLPNFLCDGDTHGLIDLADGGVADRWQDLALALWSLQHNLRTKAFGRELLAEYGITPDAQKLAYYLRLNTMDTLDVL